MSMTFKKQRPGAAAEEARQFSQKMEILAEISSIDVSQWRLCLHPFEFSRDKNPDLGQLLSNCNGNPFFNTDFLAASKDWVTHHSIYQLIVWEVIGNSLTAPIALMVQHFPRTMHRGDHFQSITHPYATFGDPLLETSGMETTLSQFNDLLNLAFETDFPLLVLDYVSANSPINKLAVLKPEQTGKHK